MNRFFTKPNPPVLFLLLFGTFWPIFSSAQKIRCQTEQGRPVEGVNLNIQSGESRARMIVPEKNDNPIEGVTTYDLVLINKHILNTEPLDTPYKMIAADANKSTSISVLDIIELRQLILGIISVLPTNTSWRFVDKNYMFPTPNPLNPDFDDFVSEIDMVASTANEVDFVAIKIGDVNNTAIANRPVERPEAMLSWPEARAKTGGVLTVPIIYSGAETLEAIQMGLRYDPAVLQLLSPSLGELPAWGPDNFNLVRPGELRTLWLPADPSDPEQLLTEGKVLFYLTFKVLAPVSESGLPIWLDNMVLDNAAWRLDGTECALLRSPSGTTERSVPTDGVLSVNCHPSPSSGALTFSVKSAKAGKGRIALFSPFGVRVLAQDVTLSAQEQEFSLPEAAQLPAGVYVWKINSNGAKAQGHWVKQ